jgi:predicted nucleic acid-binding protein
MKAKVHVDTSIWIEFFNKSQSEAGDALEQLLRDGRVVVSGIVLTELLQGAKIEKEFNTILDSIAALPFLEPNLKTWIQAGRISYSLRRKGITIPTTDVVIASLAIENSCSVFTMDPHFRKIPDVELYEGK